MLGVPLAPVLRVGILDLGIAKELRRYGGQGHLHFLTFSWVGQLLGLFRVRAAPYATHLIVSFFRFFVQSKRYRSISFW